MMFATTSADNVNDQAEQERTGKVVKDIGHVYLHQNVDQAMACARGHAIRQRPMAIFKLVQTHHVEAQINLTVKKTD